MTVFYKYHIIIFANNIRNLINLNSIFSTKPYLLLKMMHFSKVLFSTAAKKAKVGFIGCGNMGHYMVKNLLKNGFHVAAFDV